MSKAAGWPADYQPPHRPAVPQLVLWPRLAKVRKITGIKEQVWNRDTRAGA